MYQLALIFEEKGQTEEVLTFLNKGIEILKSKGDVKTLNEFRSLLAMNSDDF